MEHPYKNHPTLRVGTTFGPWEIYKVELYRYCYDISCEIGLKGCGPDFYVPGQFLESLFNECGVQCDASKSVPNSEESV